MYLSSIVKYILVQNSFVAIVPKSGGLPQQPTAAAVALKRGNGRGWGGLEVRDAQTLGVVGENSDTKRPCRERFHVLRTRTNKPEQNLDNAWLGRPFWGGLGRKCLHHIGNQS